MSRRLKVDEVKQRLYNKAKFQLVGEYKNTYLPTLLRCRCGKEKNIVIAHVINGHLKSCGCMYHQAGDKHPLWKGYKDIGLDFWTNIKTKAINRNLQFDISIEYMWDLFQIQSEKCFLSGTPLSLKRTTCKAFDHTASLDRIDSRIGYIKTNVCWVHKDLNVLKHTMDISNFIKWCHLLTHPLHYDNSSGLDTTRTKLPNGWTGYKNIPGKWFGDSKRDAQKRDIPYDLTIGDIWDMYLEQNGCCKLTGLPIFFPRGKGNKITYPRTASLDRIDSTKHYFKSNCILTHKRINIMRNNWSIEELLTFARLVSHHNRYADYIQ